MPPLRFRPARAMRPLAALGLVLASLAAPRAFAQGAWTGDFSIPSFDGTTRACAIYGGEYVVGGDFQWAAGTRAANVARWTGTGWEQLGHGLGGVVNALEPWNASLLAAISAGAPDAPVMRWDGVGWQPLGSGMYGEAHALLVDGGTVYAAGPLLLANQTNGYRVVRWTGSAWEGIGGMFDGRVRALAVWKGELYAAGEFLSGDNGYVSRIARWDGAHWASVGGGLNAGTPYIAALAVFQDRLVAGGWFDEVGGVAANGIAAWDGSTWHALPDTPNDCIVRDLEVDGGMLLVAGVLQVPNAWLAGLVSFDGQAWHVEETRPSWAVDDVAAGGGALIAVGGIAGLDTGLAPGITETNVRDVVVRDPAWRPLEAWQPTMRGLRGPVWTAVYDLHVHGGELFAGGYFSQVADPPHWRDAESMARWDGDRWQPLAGDLRGWIQALTSWNGELVAGGGLWAGDPAVSGPAAWNGSQWRSLGQLDGTVIGLAVWQDALVAIGALRTPDMPVGANAGVMVHRGQGWQPLGASLLGEWSQARAVAVFGGELYVGGGNLVLPGVGYVPLVRWDGGQWVAVPGLPQATVNALRAMQDGLWAGTTVYYRSPFSTVWSWNGIEWTDRGLPYWSVYDLGVAEGRVVAAGSGALGAGTATLARLVDGEWTAIADSPDRPVEKLAVLGRDLFVGGHFRRAGGRQAEAVARFSFDATPPGPRPPLALSAGPNPAGDHVHFRFTLARPGRVRLSVHDLTGALVARPLDEWLDAGTIEREWLPRADGVTRSGVYFAKLETPEGEAKARVVVVN